MEEITGADLGEGLTGRTLCPDLTSFIHSTLPARLYAPSFMVPNQRPRLGAEPLPVPGGTSSPRSLWQHMSWSLEAWLGGGDERKDSTTYSTQQ